MITRMGDILNTYEAVKAIHPEARWDADGSQLHIIVPASFDVEQVLAGLDQLLGE